MNKINAYQNVFEHRIKKLVKRISELRKTRQNPELLKKCLEEAKALKRKIKKANHQSKVIHTITLENGCSNGFIKDTSSAIEISSIEESEDGITIRFFIKDQ